MSNARAYLWFEGLLTKGRDKYEYARIQTEQYKRENLQDLVENLVPAGYKGYVQIEIQIRPTDPPDSPLQMEALELPVEESAKEAA